MSDELQTQQLWSQRLTTTSTAIIWVRHNANGLLSVLANNQTFNGDTIATATDDGTGVVTITGLAANTIYPITISVAGSPVHTGTIKTNPSSVSTFNVSVSGCWGNSGMPAIYETINDWAVCSHFRLGDFPYTMSMSPQFVSAAVSMDTLAANTLANVNIAQRATMATMISMRVITGLTHSRACKAKRLQAVLFYSLLYLPHKQPPMIFMR
jgi:phosphodiesterase/alkaline phosphatase D-like protein